MPIKAGFSLEDVTVQRINTISKTTRLDKSAVVDKAIELLASQDEFAHIDIPSKRPDLEAIPGIRKGADIA